MKRILPVALGIFVLLFVALLVGPSFIDWNKYKPQIIEQAKNAAGYDIGIDGDIHLSLLPSPQLKIEGLSVKAPRGSEPNLLTMKQANVSVKLLPLISGDVSIDTVRLVNPDIKLEVLPDGSTSWMSDKLLADKSEEQAPATPSVSSSSSNSFALDKLTIEDGRVSYTDRRTGKSQLVETINVDLKAGSLKGPFGAQGSLSYGGQEIKIDASTEMMSGSKKEIPANVKISLPGVDATASFKGVVAMEPLEIQGKMDINAANLASVLAIGGGEESLAFSRQLAFSGLVTANDDQVSSQEIDITFGDAKGKGNIFVTDLKEQNPVMVKADMAFEGTLNMDQLAPAGNKNDQAQVEEKVAKGEKLSPAAGLLPESISLPFPIDGTLRMTADGMQSGNQLYKGVVADVTKSASAIDIAAKILEMPGKSTAEGKAAIRFTSSSRSGEKGMTYADPSVAFTASGSSEQLPTLLRAFAPKEDGNAALEIYKTAKFDVEGIVTPAAIKVSNSTLLLDQTNIALGASYAPKGANGRPDIIIDVATDTVDIDYIQNRLNGQKNTVVQKDPAAKADVKKALEPVRSFSVPANLTFDISAQKAILNAQNINGIRIKGKAAGQSLTLDVASAQDYMGAAASLQGVVTNLQDLSGVDLKFYGKTTDLKSLMQSFKMDTSKLPQSISAAEANVSAKGKADDLAFKADVSALNGRLEAAGTMIGLLDKPSFSNLSVGAKHPNMVKAIQIMNPAFTGGEGLEQPFDFYTNAVKSGDVYDLSGLKASIGSTSFTGNLKINTGGAKPAVSGMVNAGNIALDTLLGAKTPAAQAAGTAAPSSEAGGGKWSRATIETGWMHTIDLDLALSAQSITYGGWNFTKPSTKVTLKDGNLLVDSLESGLFGGTANLSAKVQDPVDAKQPISLNIQSKMSKVGLEQLVFALSGSNRLRASGDVSLDMNVMSTGLSSHALVSGLQGKAGLDGQNVVLKGFDLAQLGLALVDTGKPMDRLNSIVAGSTSGGETRFDTIKGSYDIMQGIVTITSMAMDGASANIISKGNVNLPQWTIDTVHTMTLKQAKEAGAFDIAIKGSLSNPGNTFGKGLFNDLLTRRLQQKALEKLPDVLGDDLSGKLQGLGILPQKQAPSPVAPADPNAPAAAPAPAAEPSAQEKAIQGVLDGLLR